MPSPWLRVATLYAAWQAVALTMNAVAGFLVVRWLSVEAYAQFSIVLAVMTASIVVADSGISSTLNARAGAAGGSAAALGRLIAAARHMAIRRVPWVMAGSAGACWLLLTEGHAPAAFAWFAAALVSAYIGVVIARLLWQVVARLLYRAERILAMDAGADCLKAILMVALVWNWPMATTALLVLLALAALQWLAYRRLAMPFVAAAPADPADAPDFRVTTSQVLPVTVFFAIQGQLAMAILSILGTTADVAGLGALGRFAVVYSLAGPFVANVLSPRLAAITDPGHLRRRASQVVGSAASIAAVVTALSALLADEALALLGPNYRGLAAEFVALMTVGGIFFVVTALNAINLSKAWYAQQWLVIPATLAGQGVVAALADVSTMMGAIALSAASATALLAVYAFICTRGLTRLARPAATANTATAS